jgi:hypothetical protein
MARGSKGGGSATWHPTIATDMQAPVRIVSVFSVGIFAPD